MARDLHLISPGIPAHRGRTMRGRSRRVHLLLQAGLLAAAGILAGVLPVGGQEEYGGSALQARIWLDRGEEPLLQPGDRVRVYYRVSESSFVAIFHIDTDGLVRLVFPRSPQERHYARGGRDYRLLFPGSSYWFVDDLPGMGYFFIVASPVPFDFSDFRYSAYGGGWDLSLVGGQVYQDPYVAMDDYVASLLPEWESTDYALDFLAYHVGERHSYPRFLCYDCHGFRPFEVWNPYRYTCASFRVVIYDDPYYYPSVRYGGRSVVLTRSRRGEPRYVFKERAEGEPGSPLVVPRGRPAEVPGVAGTEHRRSPSPAVEGDRPPPTRLTPGRPGRSRTASPPGGRSGVRPPRPGADRTTPGTRRRPSGVLPRRPRSVSSTPPRRTDPGRMESPPLRPSTGRTTRPTAPPSARRDRPVLQKRVPSRGGVTPRVRGSRGNSKVRPPPRVKRKKGGGGGKPSVRSGGVRTRPVVRPPPSGSRRPPVKKRRRGGGGSLPRP